MDQWIKKYLFNVWLIVAFPGLKKSLSILQVFYDEDYDEHPSWCKVASYPSRKTAHTDKIPAITQEIIEIQDEDPILMLEKAKNFAKEFLGIIEGQKRKLSEEYELDLQSLEAQKKKYTADDFQFIESMSVPNKPRNWKKIYDAGKIKDLFNSYTSADSLKSSYHHAIGRAKKQK
ncbi:hypothetical protein EDC96DRAFT_595833 [Choanephora cucurbitarum]|nr:hypothetical protein EDC96DRAFT_595833 [Choanephora cucurbitarum]